MTVVISTKTIGIIIIIIMTWQLNFVNSVAYNTCHSDYAHSNYCQHYHELLQVLLARLLEVKTYDNCHYDKDYMPAYSKI